MKNNCSKNDKTNSVAEQLASALHAVAQDDIVLADLCAKGGFFRNKPLCARVHNCLMSSFSWQLLLSGVLWVSISMRFRTKHFSCDGKRRIHVVDNAIRICVHQKWNRNRKQKEQTKPVTGSLWAFSVYCTAFHSRHSSKGCITQSMWTLIILPMDVGSQFYSRASGKSTAQRDQQGLCRALFRCLQSARSGCAGRKEPNCGLMWSMAQ